MKYFLVKSPAEVVPILWDGTAPLAPAQGYALMTEAEFALWRIDNPEPPPPPPEIPWAISNADLRRQLVANGINPALILAHLNSMQDGQAKWLALADWEYANYFERSHPMINALAPAFGLSAEAVDAMFLACPAYPRL